MNQHPAQAGEQRIRMQHQLLAPAAYACKLGLRSRGISQDQRDHHSQLVPSIRCAQKAPQQLLAHMLLSQIQLSSLCWTLQLSCTAMA